MQKEESRYTYHGLAALMKSLTKSLCFLLFKKGSKMPSFQWKGHHHPLRMESEYYLAGNKSL
jgi:hypothetical protein